MYQSPTLAKSRFTQWLVITALGALITATTACTNDDDPGDAEPELATTTSTEPVDDRAGTFPASTGTATLTLGDETYQASIGFSCALNEDDYDLVAFGTHGDQDIRIEHGRSTEYRVALFIGVTDPIDPGDQTWIGQPDQTTIDDTTLNAGPFDMTRTDTDQTQQAELLIDCDQ